MSSRKPFTGSWSHTGLIGPENSSQMDAFPISSRLSQYTKEFRARHSLLLHPDARLIAGIAGAAFAKQRQPEQTRSACPCPADAVNFLVRFWPTKGFANRRNKTNECSGRVLTFSTRRELSKESAPQSLRNFELNTSPTAATVADVVWSSSRQRRPIHSSNVKLLIRKRGTHSSNKLGVEATYEDLKLSTMLSVDCKNSIRNRQHCAARRFVKMRTGNMQIPVLPRSYPLKI